MLRYVDTDIFKSPAQTIVNTVNTVGVMGKGIARDFKRLYPDMYRKYRAFCKDGRFDVGQLYLYRTPNKWVLNFPTKKHWRNPSRIEWIEAGLRKFVDTYVAHGISSVSFPQLGTGNGGLEWDDVRPVMERHLGKLRIPVFIHVRHQAPDFIPEHMDPNELRRLRSEYHASRETIAFEDFLNDVAMVLGASKPEWPQLEDTPDLPSLEAMIGDWTATLRGEDLRDLWQALRGRGAVSATEFPSTLRVNCEQLLDHLLELEYLARIDFVEESGTTPGIMLAPGPSDSKPTKQQVLFN